MNKRISVIEAYATAKPAKREGKLLPFYYHIRIDL